MLSGIKRIAPLVGCLVFLLCFSGVTAAGNSSASNHSAKSEKRQSEQVSNKNKDMKIENHYRLKVEDLDTDTLSGDDDPEEDPWDDGVDMGC